MDSIQNLKLSHFSRSQAPAWERRFSKLRFLVARSAYAWIAHWACEGEAGASRAARSQAGAWERDQRRIQSKIQNPKSSSADTRVPARVRNRRQHGTCRHQSHGWTRALCEQVANGETCETDSPTGDVPNELCLTEFGVSGQRRLSVGGAIARGWGSEARGQGEQKARNAKPFRIFTLIPSL